MGAWERQQPVAVDVSRLPVQWELIHDPASRHFAVVGRSDLASIDVVLRIDYAVADDGADIRSMVGSAVLRGLELVRHQRREPREPRTDREHGEHPGHLEGNGDLEDRGDPKDP